MKPTKEPSKKKPKYSQMNCPNRCCNPPAVKKHRHKFDRCYDLVHKAGAAHVEYCQCGKKKP